LRRYTTLAAAPTERGSGGRSGKGRILGVSTRSTPRLAARLATVPGLTARADVPLARLTTLRIGGPAELLVEASSARAVGAAVRACRESGTPLLVVGLGSNVLLPDEGLEGVVLRLTGDLKRARIRDRRISAGGGIPLAQVARRAARAGLAGLEALSGFPSTVGGAVRMNAGAYGTEMRDVLRSVLVVDRDGERRRLAVGDLGASYRRTRLAESGEIVVRALFELAPGDPGQLLARIDELNTKRWKALPSGVPNAGSIFRNPEGDFAGRLLEACGMKGRRQGGAAISDRHANVIVNEGGATAQDVLALMRACRAAVAARFGLELEPEVVLVGRLRGEWAAGA